MVKKLLSAAVAAAIILTMTACTQQNSKESTDADTAPQSQTTKQYAAKPADIFCATYNDVTVYPGQNFSDVSTDLEEPLDAANTDNDGAGSIYTYDGMEISTAYVNDKEVIKKITILKSTVKTCEGIEVAMPTDMAQEMSQADFQISGNDLVYNYNEYQIKLSFDESGIYAINMIYTLL